MFTGIISDIGHLREVSDSGNGTGRRLVINTDYATSGILIGASIACSGPCLTVVGTGPDWFAAEVSAETLEKTNLAGWRPGQRINLARALCLGDELGGHLVSGHVDGVGELASRRADGDSVRMSFSVPAALMRFIAGKGSIAVDGVSLTVNEVGAREFCVNIIPHTQTATTLGDLEPNGTVNLEIDLLARYVARLGEEI